MLNAPNWRSKTQSGMSICLFKKHFFSTLNRSTKRINNDAVQIPLLQELSFTTNKSSVVVTKMVPSTGYLNWIVIDPFWQLVHSIGRRESLLITGHQASLLPDNAEKQIFMKTTQSWKQQTRGIILFLMLILLFIPHKNQKNSLCNNYSDIRFRFRTYFKNCYTVHP